MLKNYNPEQLFWPMIESKPKHSQMIPKIIHQMWLGDDPPMNLIETWQNMNPDWHHILWTEKKLKQWKFRNQDKIDLMVEPNGRCDIMRYEILHRMGGFFVDADTACIQPLDDELFNYDCVSVFEGEAQRGGLIACGFMAAQPGCKLMQFCIEEMEKVASPAWWYVGPAYFTHIVQKYEYPIKIYPSYYFIPKHYLGPMYKGRGPVYCDHFWGVTHKEGYERFKKLIIEPTQAEKLKAQPYLPGLQIRGTCRRKGILCQYLRMRRGYAPVESLSIGGRTCNRKPNSATHLMKVRSPSLRD